MVFIGPQAIHSPIWQPFQKLKIEIDFFSPSKQHILQSSFKNHQKLNEHFIIKRVKIYVTYKRKS